MTLDFDRWFQRQAPVAPEAEPDLPVGVWDRGGKLMATCLSCGRDYELPCDPNEFTADTSYCGGSPRCLP